MIRVSHSDISEFIRCPRKFYWSYVLDLHGPEKLWGPLACGNRVHAAVQEKHQKGTDPRVAHQRMAERDEAVLMSRDVPGWAMDEFYADVIMGRNCCAAYQEWTEREGPYDGYTLLSEVVLEAPFPGKLADRVMLIGKVDMVLVREIDGWIETDDIKTASIHTRTSLPPTLEKSYQHVVYQVLASILNPDQVVGQAHYTVLYKAKVPARVVHPMVERFHVPGRVASLPIRKLQLEQILTNMLEFIDRAEGDSIAATAAYPVPADSCRWCDFRHPCALADETPRGAEEMLRVEFTRGGRHARYDTDLTGDLE